MQSQKKTQNEGQRLLNRLQMKVDFGKSPTVSSEGLIAEGDDNVCTAPIMAAKDILELVQSSKNIIDTIDYDGENEMKNVTSVPMSSEMRSIMKSMRSYLDAHSNGEMSNKMDDFEQFI
ncbi:hypothetical protein TNCV_1359681 [Trichonephila clavipes]|nr:hypothetical protein TNCV_1359681 [Trichonephila clavipes]